MTPELHDKLSAARARLILDHPFLGALTLRLPLRAGDPRWCKTSATDARAIYFNGDYLADLTGAETEFVLAHEALHCALGHFHRRQHRNRSRWDLACDLAINPLLKAEGLKAPPGTLALDEFAGMTAEEIYPCLDDNDDQETLDQHLYDQDSTGQGQGGGGAEGSQSPQSGEGEPPLGGGQQTAPSPPDRNERERLAAQWRQHLATAAQQALQAGRLSPALARYVDRLIEPRLPWRALLARYLQAAGREDYSYARPARREGAAILPALRSHQIDVVAVIDTSGSINTAELNEFVAELNALKGQVSARITLHACDNELAGAGPWECEVWESLLLPESIAGGGGTSFRPIFSWLGEQGCRPDLLIYFTDAHGEFPATPPDYPVVWLVKGAAAVPWGERIQLN